MMASVRSLNLNRSESMYSALSRNVLLIVILLLLGVVQSYAKFNPPRIIQVVRGGGRDTGAVLNSAALAASQERTYYMDRGSDANINVGNVLNVYREKKIPLGLGMTQSMRILMGTMTITASQEGISVGRFAPDLLIVSNPMVRVKGAMKGDTVVPKLKLDSSVLFDPGQSGLTAAAQQELEKVAQFVQNFSPTTLVIEGHTDSDGDESANQLLSEMRAKIIKDWLVTSYEYITGDMTVARGYGEMRPLVSNDTPENKALNRRIEIVVWE